MAKKIGVPFGNLCAGVNINDFTHRAFSTGKVQKPKSGEPMKPSLSDAINIQLPYNLERLLFYLTGQDHAQVKIWYDRLECNRGESSSSIDLTEEISSDHSASEVDASTERTINSNNNNSWLAKLQTEFRSARVTDSALCATIQHVLETYGYWADPHTGVAFDAAKQLGYLSTSLPEEGGSGGIGGGSGVSTSVVAIMATASPCKFEAAMTKILGLDKWKEYELYHFPTRGKDLKDKKEKSPLRYLADEGKTLKENQLAWESKTKELIAKLGR
jgi:threonine synthase